MTDQRGVSSILLIAIIVLMASMATFALRFVAGAQGNASAFNQTLRVQQAAESGMEWLRYRLRTGQCAPTTNITIPMSAGSIQATVTCVPTAAVPNSDFSGAGPVPGANENLMSYTLTSTACWPQVAPNGCPHPSWATLNYSERQVRAVATCTMRAPPAPQVCTW